jgi:hypothetical protein
MLGGGVNRQARVAGDADALLRLEQRRETVPQYGMIVYQQHADRIEDA